MPSLFNQKDSSHILTRIEMLQPAAMPQWGKMNAAQMLAHCSTGIEMYFGKKKLKRAFVGVLFGKMARKKLLADKPWPRNLPTAKELIIAEDRPFDKEKVNLISQVMNFSVAGRIHKPPVHPFFGRMSADEWALLTYKHLDHHLQQFGV